MSLAAAALGTSLLAVLSTTPAHALGVRATDTDAENLPFIGVDGVERMTRPLDRFVLEAAVRRSDAQRAREAYNSSPAGERELLRAQKQGAEEALLATLSEGMTTVLPLIEETVVQSKQGVSALLDRPDAFQRLVSATFLGCVDSTTIALTVMDQQLDIYERFLQLRANMAVAIAGNELGESEEVYRDLSKLGYVDPARPSISELAQQLGACRSTAAPLDDLDAVIQ